MRNRELNLLRAALKQVHVRPRDDVLAQWLANSLSHAAHHALQRRMNCTQQATRTHVGAQQAQLIFARGRKLDVVYAHDLHALRIHNLLIHDVAHQQQLRRLQVREANIGGRILEVHAVVVKVIDVLAPRNHKRSFGRTLERQRGYTRKDLARGDTKVVDDAHLFACRVNYRQLEHLGKIVHSAPIQPYVSENCVCSWQHAAKRRAAIPHARISAATWPARGTRRG